MRLLIAVAAALALLPASAAAQTPAPNPEPTLLAVTGDGVVRAKPDTATISIFVRRVGVEREKPRASVNRRTRQIIRAVTRLGVRRAEIQTSGISLDQRRLRRRGGRVRIRYVASNLLTVRTTAIEVVGRIFDVATRAGATDFSGPEFQLVNRTAPRAAATEAAVADARRRADAAARALGLRVIGVQSVALDGAEIPTGDDESEDSVREFAGSESGGGSTPVRPGVEEVDAQVSVVYILGI